MTAQISRTIGLIIPVLLAALAVPATAATPSGTIISNQASVEYSAHSTNFSISSNVDEITVEDGGSLNSATATLSHSPQNAHPGDTIVLDVSLENTGSNDLADGEFRVTPPTGSTLTVPDGITVSQAGDTFILSLADIATGDTLTFQAMAELPMDVPIGTTDIPVRYDANGTTIIDTHVTVGITSRTAAEIRVWRYDNASGSPLAIPVTKYYDGSTYIDIAVPLLPGTGTPVTDAPIPLSSIKTAKKSQTIFFSIDDIDHNLDDDVAETIEMNVQVQGADGATIDTEQLLVTETTPDSGVFVGYIQSFDDVPASYDGTLSVETNSSVRLLYDDNVDNGDSTEFNLLIDPYGILFDSNTGAPVNGATVSFINADTGAPATVYGDDGVSSYPSTVVSGGTATDSSGTVYDFPDGFYRFPFAPAGNYRLEITLPDGSGYRWPSSATDTELQSLPNGPFTIDVGSRGETFVLQDGPPLRIDIPLDPVLAPLFVTKNASKDIVASGDFLQYRVTIENTQTLSTATAATLTDILPHGLRYRKGSARVNDAPAPDPQIGADGRTLSFALGDIAPETIAVVTYVVQVGTANLGEAINFASATATGGVNSNTASATIEIIEDLMRSRGILLGRVLLDSADTESGGKNNQGVANIRIYLEDGSYVLTDERGMFHFEGLKPGTHVVQLDVDSLPEQYEVVSAGDDTRFAGRTWSKFVDMQGGSLWHVDFKLKLKPRAVGSATLRMDTALTPGRNHQYRFDVGTTGVPLHNTRLIVMLPDDVEPVPGTVRNGGAETADPERNANMLTFRLGDLPADGNIELAFDARVGSADADELVSKATIVFDTPTGANQRTPVAESTLSMAAGKTKAVVSQAVEIHGLRPGETWTKPARDAEQNGDGRTTYDKLWIETVKPGFELLFPKPDDRPSIPAVHVGIKHAPAESVELLLNDKPVDKTLFEHTIKNKAGTVAFSLWRGVHLIEGENLLEVVTRNHRSEETGRLRQSVHYAGPPVRAELVESRSVLVADGLTNPVIAVRLFDRDGEPVRKDAGGAFRVHPPYAPVETDDFDDEVLPGAPPEIHRYLVGEDGIAEIVLQPTTEADDVTITFPLVTGEYELKAPLRSRPRDWILVGFAEGTVGHNTLNGNVEPLPGTAAEENLYQDGRVALFAKGQIRGEWLLTMAYDSDKEKRNSLKQVIDPGSYYTIYGDTSTQRYDAASNEKLYLKIERHDFYALYGDFDTDLTTSELSRYSRSLTGLKSKYRDDRYEVLVFASESDQAFVRDEIRGRGISGPYSLSRRNLVINSEKVTIQVRDRFRSEVIVSEQVLTRHADYDIDYQKGTLRFRTAVSSTDSQLNHVFILVNYESWDEIDRSTTFGGRAQANATDRLQVGITHITEGVIGNEHRLHGTDVVYEFSPETLATVEYARTDNEALGGNANDSAWLTEIEHRSAKLDARAYLREQGRDFGLGQQNGSESGTRKAGAEANYRVTDNVDLYSQAYRQTHLPTRSEQDMIHAETRYQRGATALRGGVRSARDRLADGETRSSDLVTAGVNQGLMDGRLTLRMDREQAIGGNDASTDFPSLTRLGADYRLTGTTLLFVEQEWANGADRETEQSRLGLITKPWAGADISTAIRQTRDSGTESTAADVGLRQQWAITERWSADVALERSKVLSGNTPATPLNINTPPAHGLSEDASAASVGLTYRPGGWIWNLRADYRNSASEDNRGLFTSIQTQPRADLGTLLSLTLIDRQTAAGLKSLTSNVRLGLAWRPDEGDWLLLNKLDWIQDRSIGGNFDLNNWRVVNNLNANYRHNKKWQSSLQYGAKYVNERIDSVDYNGYTDLLGYETRYNITRRWDVGLRASVLHAWEVEQYDYSAGASIGHSFVDNVWVSVGYNVTGFKDRDFSAENYTSKGPFVTFRIKFDQQSVREATEWLRR